SLQIPFKEKRVRLTCLCEPEEISVPIDRERIRHALLNLLQNALHASTEGKEVRLTAAMDGDSVKIAVEDQGKGIPREDMDRIFLPFFSTKPKGTGLGLAITHAIVREHGGGISVESVVEKGTRILVELPITRIQPPVHESAPVERRP
ncbi:MAG: ATP-binding protein, partial [Thermodesulfobacteriota bacterium]